MTTRKVEIHPAHVWTCDDCGRDNFCRGVVFEPDAEEMAEMKEHFGDYVGGDWMTAPEEVTCCHCGATFETEVPC